MALDRGTEHDQNGHQLYNLCDGSWARRVEVGRIGAVHLYNVRCQHEMTWVVAGNGAIYPFIAGDVRVTFCSDDGQRTERDCLQKIHPLTRNILGGFAGSVRAGFFLLQVIRRQMYEEHWYSLPKITRRWMTRLMRRAFADLPANERSAGSQWIMVGAHPDLTRGPFKIPRAHTYRFSSPTFEPEETIGVECLGIGSGDTVVQYRDAASQLSKDFVLHQTSTMGLKWPAHTMAATLHSTVSGAPMPGISPYFLYGSVSLTEVLIEAFEYEERRPEGTRLHRLPPIARTYDEFIKYCGSEGLSAEAAIASRYDT